MTNNSYISLGFGYDMNDVDMIGWHANGETAFAEDYWSTSKITPKVDAVSNLVSTHEITEGKKTVKWVTKRKLDTGDLAEDYLIPLNDEIDIVWAIGLSSGDWKYHDLWGRFRMTFDESLGNLPKAKTSTPVEKLGCLKNSWDDF